MRRQGRDRRRAPWLLALLVAIGVLGTELRGQSRLERECPATLTLQTSPSFEDPPESLRYEWRDGQGALLGRESQVAVELRVGTHTHVSVVTAPDGRTARDEITVVVEDTRPPDLRVGVPLLDLPAVAADDVEVDLVAAMRITADDACDRDPPTITWDPPPPYAAGDTTVTFAATDQAGNRASTQALVRVAVAAARPTPVTPAGSGTQPNANASGSVDTRASGRPARSTTPPGRGPTSAPPAASSGTTTGDSGAPARTETGAGVRVSGGPASIAGGLTPGGAGTGASVEPGGAAAASTRVTTPAVFGVGIPASGLGWGGVALGVGTLLVAWLLVTRRRARSSRTGLPTPVVFRAVAKPSPDAVHTIRPSYVPPRYRLGLRPHAAAGTHTVVRSDETASPREEP